MGVEGGKKRAGPDNEVSVFKICFLRSGKPLKTLKKGVAQTHLHF